MALTKKDIQKLGKVMEQKLADHSPVFTCPNGITPKTAEGIKALVELINNGQKITTRVLITAFWLGIISLVVAGFWSKLCAMFR